MRTHLRRHLALTAPLLAATLSSCILVAREGKDGEWSVHAPDHAEHGEDDQPKGAAKAAEADDEREALAAKIAIARLELQIAELEAEAKRIGAAYAIERKKHAVGDAQRAHEHFQTTETPLRIDAAQVELDEKKFAAVMKEAELRELEAMYAQEGEFAAQTKELVLNRGRRELEFAQRELAIAERELAKLRDQDLPKDLREKEQALADARAELIEAELEARKAELETKLGVDKAKQELADAEREAAKDAKKAKAAAKAGADEDDEG